MPELQEPINQHYVPQGYLKQFAGLQKQIRKYKILEHLDWQRKTCSYKNCCSEDYFYNINPELDAELQVKENIWAPIFVKISKDFPLSDAEWEELKVFIVYQALRTRRALDAENAMWHAAQRALSGQEYFAADDYFMNMNIDDIMSKRNSIVREIADLDICLIKYETKRELITSDHPVLTLNFFDSSATEPYRMGIMLLVPISPRHLLVTYDSVMYQHLLKSRELVRSDSEDDVLCLNNYQYLNAGSILISHPDSPKYVVPMWIKHRGDEHRQRQGVHINNNSQSNFNLIMMSENYIPTEQLLSFSDLFEPFQYVPWIVARALTRKHEADASIDWQHIYNRIAHVKGWNFGDFQLDEDAIAIMVVINIAYHAYWHEQEQRNLIYIGTAADSGSNCFGIQ